MKFDVSKVRSEWSDELEGKKGWFSNFITDRSQINLQYYVENEVKGDVHDMIYGICRRNDSNTNIFRIDGFDGHYFTYFYPDDREDNTMELQEFLNMSGTYLDIQKDYVAINNLEVKDGCVLISITGRGKTTEDAIIDLCKRISNRTVVANAYLENRKEYNLPKIIYRRTNIMEFDKKNLFIAGYNDEEVNIGDEGFVGISIEQIKNDIKNNKKTVGIIQSKITGYFGLNNKSNTSYQMFYRTKCAPQKKYIPWTDKTVPDDLLLKIVKDKALPNRDVITGIDKGEEYPIKFSNTLVTYKWLFKQCVMDSDGTPCGQEVAE
jgi:hypothetical protein